MSDQTNHNGYLSEAEIDQKVVAQAEDDEAWEDAIHVQRSKSISLLIPADLAGRAAFLARYHRQASVEEWLTDIIAQRVSFEDAALAGAKQALIAK